jgi:hypothetical protein
LGTAQLKPTMKPMLNPGLEATEKAVAALLFFQFLWCLDHILFR